MVKLLSLKNAKNLINIVCCWFDLQKHLTHITSVDKPELDSCIYAMWHADQFSLYGLKNESNINIMISKSIDGEVIAKSIEKVFGFKAVRGSKGRMGAVEATKQLVEILKDGGKGAIMVDGPKGPLHVVKKGIIRIAKLSGRPIVPMHWYSSNFNFFKLPTWDKFTIPIGDVRLIILYGKPIYVPSDIDEEGEEQYRLELENSLKELDKQAPTEFDKVYWHGLWKRKK